MLGQEFVQVLATTHGGIRLNIRLPSPLPFTTLSSKELFISDVGSDETCNESHGLHSAPLLELFTSPSTENPAQRGIETHCFIRSESRGGTKRGARRGQLHSVMLQPATSRSPKLGPVSMLRHANGSYISGSNVSEALWMCSFPGAADGAVGGILLGLAACEGGQCDC